jgi:hypothetical protein
MRRVLLLFFAVGVELGAEDAGVVVSGAAAPGVPGVSAVATGTGFGASVAFVSGTLALAVCC